MQSIRRSTVSCTKTAEPIEMPFGMKTRVGSNHCCSSSTASLLNEKLQLKFVCVFACRNCS